MDDRRDAMKLPWEAALVHKDKGGRRCKRLQILSILSSIVPPFPLKAKCPNVQRSSLSIVTYCKAIVRPDKR